jgi:hypothetical protein
MGRETGSLHLLAPLLLTGGKGADLVIRGNVVLNNSFRLRRKRTRWLAAPHRQPNSTAAQASRLAFPVSCQQPFSVKPAD